MAVGISPQAHAEDDEEIDPELAAEVSQGLESAYKELEVAYNRLPSVEDFRIEKFLASMPDVPKNSNGPAVDDLLAAVLGMPKASPSKPRRGGAPSQRRARSQSTSVGQPSPRPTTPPPASVSSNGINRTHANARIEAENQVLSARLARVRPTVPRASTPQRGTPRTAR
jgi:hypothetical protein